MIMEENGEVECPKNKELFWTAKDLASGTIHYFTDRESANIYALAVEKARAASIRPPVYVMED